MDGDVVFIEGPIDLELFGPLVRATVTTGVRHYVFVATMHDFLESFARASELRAKWAIKQLDTVVELRQH
jgi:hypothetical protein